MIKITGSNFIGGVLSSNGKKTYHSINPLTKEKSKTLFIDADKKEIKNASEKAFESYHEIQKFSNDKRAELLINISSEIKNLGDQLIQIAKWETALTDNRLKNERARTCNQLEMFANFIKEGSYVEAIIDKPEDNPNINITKDVRRMLIPIGPVVVFPASNFPFAFGVCGGDTASAIAAGCPVLVKCHPSNPQTSELFTHAVYKAIKKTGFPKDMFSMIHGKHKETFDQLIKQANVQAIAFTGSLKAGRAIHNLAASRQNPIPVYAEMGSINPVFITPLAIQKKCEKTTDILSESITMGAGQFCTKPGIIFLPEKSDIFIKTIIDKIKSKQTGCLINEKVKDNLIKITSQIKKLNGVKTIKNLCEFDNQNSFENTIFITDYKTYQKNELLQNECFGPVVTIVKCKKIDNYIEIIKNLNGQLTGSVHMHESEKNLVKPLILELSKKVGRILINDIPTGVQVCYSMNHGGPYPATTNIFSTSVGMMAIKRFLRPIAYQNTYDELLPDQLKNKNFKKILRLENQEFKIK